MNTLKVDACMYTPHKLEYILFVTLLSDSGEHGSGGEQGTLGQAGMGIVGHGRRAAKTRFSRGEIDLRP